VTAVPEAKNSLQSLPQLMPGPVTVPLVGTGSTVSEDIVVVNVAVTELLAVMVTVQVPAEPAQAPPHPLRVPPLAVRTTVDPAGKLAAHVPALQPMPAGSLVTVPSPLTATESA
jgi:hypothetical protein